MNPAASRLLSGLTSIMNRRQNKPRLRENESFRKTTAWKKPKKSQWKTTTFLFTTATYESRVTCWLGREAPSAATCSSGPGSGAPIEPPRYHRALECECERLCGVPSLMQPCMGDLGITKKKKKKEEQTSSPASLESMTDEHELQQTVH